MKKFTFKGVLDGIRSSVAPQIKPDQEIVETLRSDNFQVAKVSARYDIYHHRDHHRVSLDSVYRYSEPYCVSPHCSTCARLRDIMRGGRAARLSRGYSVLLCNGLSVFSLSPAAMSVARAPAYRTVF